MDISGDSHSLYTNDGTIPFSETYTDIPQIPQHTFAIATGDYNNDGFPDIVSHKLGTFASLFKGSTNNNNWLKVNLVGVGSNTFGIGCDIEINAIMPNGEVFSLNEKVISGEKLKVKTHTQMFGLNNASAIQSILVNWMGVEEIYLGPFEINTSITLIEGASDLDNTSSEWQIGCTCENACNFSDEATFDSGDCDF